MEHLSIDQLRLNPKNPRRHSLKKIRSLARSIGRFGMNGPVLVDAQCTLLSGEARVRACRELGWKSVPVIRLEHLTEAEAQVFMLAENRFSELAAWDDQALGQLLNDLAKQGLDFSLELSGFETGKIDFLIAALDFSTGEDAPPPIADAGQSITSLGETWILENRRKGLIHRLTVGDALQAASYVALMAGERAAAIITDPPFGPSIASYLPTGRTKHREFVMGSEGRTPEQLASLLEPACQHMQDNADPGALVYIFMDWRGLQTLLGVGGRVFGELKNLIVWAKTNAGMGAHYRSQHELVAMFKVAGGPHRNNIQLGVHGRNRSNLWTYAGMTSPSARKTSEGDLLAAHPTVKPVDMIADAILDCTERGDIVLDPFLGSGTTIIAAERTGRRAYGLELDPLYADVAIRRFRQLTGETPYREADGRSFDDLEAETIDE